MAKNRVESKEDLVLIPDDNGTFDSFDGFIDFVDGLDDNEPWNADYDGYRSSKKGDFDFCKTASWADAINLARYGWHEGLEKITQATPMLPQRDSIALRHSVTGILPNVPAYCAGIPESMYAVYKQKRHTSAVKIYVNLTYAWMCEENQIVTHGASILSFVNALEQQNISCEVIGYVEVYNNTTSAKSGNLARLEIALKTAGQPLDSDRFAFCLMHPSFLRRLFFRWLERPLYDHGDFPRSHGCVNIWEPDNKDGFNIGFLRHDDKISIEKKVSDLEKRFREFQEQ